MASNLSLRTRTAAVAALTAASAVALAGPARAESTAPMPGSASDSVMTTGQALAVFVGIPLIVIALVYLLVAAPGWTRSGRADSTAAWTGDPVVIAGSGDAARAVSGSADGAPPALGSTGAGTEAVSGEAGGTSAAW